MKKLIIITLSLIATIAAVSQNREFILRNGNTLVMKKYDSTAVANAIASKQIALLPGSATAISGGNQVDWNGSMTQDAIIDGANNYKVNLKHLTEFLIGDASYPSGYIGFNSSSSKGWIGDYNGGTSEQHGNYILVDDGSRRITLHAIEGEGYIRIFDKTINDASASNGYVWTLTDNTTGGGKWATLPASGGTVTSVDVSGGSTGLSFSGGPVSTSGIITAAGTLGVSYGGTGLNTYSQGDILYFNSGSTFSRLAKNTSATRYLSNTGTSNNPAWTQIDLSNGVTGILPSANGGTGNGFIKFSGPASSEKIFTLPNAASTILTDNAVVTVAQGGIGIGTLASNGVLYGNGISAVQALAVNATATNKFLRQVSSGAPSWQTLAAGDIPDLSGTYQPLDGDLTTIASLTATTDNFIVGTSSAWASRTPSQARSQLGATTIGGNIFTLTNPSALGYIRANADNTVTHRTYANVKTDLSLDAVENTALSTWAGSANITTNGTITSGGLGTGAVIGGTTMALGSDGNYDIYYRNSLGVLTRLPAGTDGNILTTHSTTSAPTWTAPGAGSGDVVLASSIQSVTGKKTFDKDKFAMKGTSTGVTTYSTANTSGTDYSFTTPAADITAAQLTDLTTSTSASTASTLSKRDANANISHNNVLFGYATTATAAGTTTLDVASKYFQYFTGSTTQTVTMPVASTLVLGQSWEIDNLSTGNVTIQSSGPNTIVIIAGNTSVVITCILTSGTGTASWNYTYNGTAVASGKKLTVSNSLTLAGTDATTMTFPATSATIARTDAAQTFTGTQIFSSTISGSVNGNAATVTTNANLTGDVTSSGNATTITAPSETAVDNNTGGWVTKKVSGSDVTTTGQTLVDITGLVSGTLSTSSKYEIEAMLMVSTSAVTTGVEYGVNCTGTGTAQGVLYMGPSTVTASVQVLNETGTNGNNVAETPAFLTTASETGTIWIHGYVETGTGSPTIAIRHLKVTSGTSTVKIGSSFRYRKLGFDFISWLLLLSIMIIRHLIKKASITLIKNNKFMKHGFFLLSIIVLVGTKSFSQTLSVKDSQLTLTTFSSSSILNRYPFLNSSDISEVSSRYDTAVLYVGDILCAHKFSERKMIFSMISCAAMHDAAGCPNDWYNNNWICIKCLRHINVRETRFVVKKTDEYKTALEKLNKLELQCN